MDDPIFLNGQFRTRSTWWFTKFRNAPGTRCFYAPLTPSLSDRTPKEVGSYSNKKSLRHEKTDNYFMEYPGFPNGIVPYAQDWSQQSYSLAPNAKEPEMEAYITSLIEYAHSKSQRPVFKLNLGLLLGAWLKEHFGGTHIFLDRDVPSLRRSFDSMRGWQSWAWKDLMTIAGQNHDHPVFKPLADHLGYHPEKKGYEDAGKQAMSFWLRQKNKGEFTQETKFELVTYFQELARAHAKDYADYTIGNIEDETHLEKTQEEIRELTGVKVDLSSYKYKEAASPHETSIEHLLTPAINALPK